nr:MAG TPA: hypothetical protein [Caudoviricetes sp.]
MYTRGHSPPALMRLPNGNGCKPVRTQSRDYAGYTRQKGE